MIMPFCPICSGSSFSEFRGRENAQCGSCQSLERHRTFTLFMLWVEESFSKLVLSSPSSVKRADQITDGVQIDFLESLKIKSSESNAATTMVFLDNVVGFREINRDQRQMIRALSEEGATVAFTCRSGSIEKQRSNVDSLIGRKHEIRHFDPRDAFGDAASVQFRLGLDSNVPGNSDIFFSVAGEKALLPPAAQASLDVCPVERNYSVAA